MCYFGITFGKSLRYIFLLGAPDNQTIPIINFKILRVINPWRDVQRGLQNVKGDANAP